MSNDQGDSPTRYYVQELDRGAEGLNWAIYERLPHGSTMIALCYTGEMAQRILGLLDGSTRAEPDATERDATEENDPYRPL